ncbi:YggS family pyridoxal phosphate-dependent enzyme [Calycomorphotria hydatis]|uniref:Pyridoxal phosphate homeostasis protein n=1 Tax=Calycomorphotria hydatis TaxID=2528027 RepID=A0A517T723_9PLAN|nr:YggS family pyridoxal phosphate-dependent enzyme [Calycomorphotria hydatis]QDT64175.1 Pyridoxal phosphate homeostasis protein [Calycomorphotria hydatis]
MSVTENYTTICRRVEEACGRVGRDPNSVKLIAVTKYAEVDWVRELLDCGHRVLGESRPQQLIERAELFEDEGVDPEVEWHLIGHLQRNKVRKLLPYLFLTHSIDGWKLLAAVDRIAGEIGLVANVLLEMNLSEEPTKHGFSQQELFEGWEQLGQLPNVKVDGLMTMAPNTGSLEDAREAFRQLSELRNQLRERSPELPLPELSMGMSGDYEVAIEEGATMVRIGSALYEGCSS